MKEIEKNSEKEFLNGKQDSKPPIKIAKKESSSCSDYTLFLYVLLIMIVFGVLIFLFFYIHYGSYKIELLVAENSIDNLIIDMIKPLVDDRKYRLIKLSNNLEVLLISDINASTSSAALSVGVGSFKDDEISGLAHFCEHMIFLV